MKIYMIEAFDYDYHSNRGAFLNKNVAVKEMQQLAQDCTMNYEWNVVEYDVDEGDGA